MPIQLILSEHAVLRYRLRIAPELDYFSALSELENALEKIELTEFQEKVKLQEFTAFLVKIGNNEALVKTVLPPKIEVTYICKYCLSVYRPKPHQRSMHKRLFCKPLCEKKYKDERMKVKRYVKKKSEWAY